MARPFPHRGVELHHGFNLDPAGDATRDHYLAILRHAASLELTHFFLSESWPQGLSRLVRYDAMPELAETVDAAAVDRRRENLRIITDEAARLGISIWGTINPIPVPDGFLDLYPDAAGAAPAGWDRTVFRADGHAPAPPLCPYHPAVRRLVETQVSEILDRDGIDGLSCWLNMSDSLVFACDCGRCRQAKMPRILADVANHLHAVCRRRNKPLNIRTYLGSWQCGLETAAFLEAAPLMDDDIYICYKQQQGDMYNDHPVNPLVGRLAPHPEMIEFDTYGEYRGQSLGVVCSVRRQMQERMKVARDAGVVGTVVRGMHHLHPFSIDADLFAALSLDPDLDNDAWCRRWLEDRFGSGAAVLLAILDRAWEVCRRAMYIRGVHWSSWSVPQTLDRLRFILYDRSASTIPGAFERLATTDRMIDEVRRSHDEAIALAGENVAACETLAGLVPDDARRGLTASMQVLHGYAAMVRPLIQAVLRTFQWERVESATVREFRRLELLPMVHAAEEAIDKTGRAFAAIDMDALAPYLGPIELVPRQPHERLHPPLENGRQICADIRARLDIAPTSFTGIAPWPPQWPASASLADFGDPNGRISSPRE